MAAGRGKHGAMKKSLFRSRRSRSRHRLTADEREHLLARFDRSGLSAAEFARQHGLHYTTFCGWRQRRDRAHIVPAFVEVELPVPTATTAASTPVELMVELGTHARLRLHCAAQVELAARLLQALHTPPSC